MVRHFALAAALFAGSATAQPVDSVASVGCREALAALQAQEAAVLAASPAAGRADPALQHQPPARLLALRREAARACLGGSGELPPPQQVAQPPIVVAPIRVARPAAAPALPTGPVRPPPPPAAPPATITGCDTAGCWASDGSRLTRAGPNLQGPRGLCSVQGTLLVCP